MQPAHSVSFRTLGRYLTFAVEVDRDRPVLVDKFLDRAVEMDVDALCDKDGNVVVCALMEHIEQAGIHSGEGLHAMHPAGWHPLESGAACLPQATPHHDQDLGTGEWRVVASWLADQRGAWLHWKWGRCIPFLSPFQHCATSMPCARGKQYLSIELP